MKKSILTLFLISFFTPNVQAQNYIYEEGQSGFSLSGTYAFTSGNNSSYGITPMYTINGRFTAGLSIAGNKIERNYGTSFIPQLSYIFIKKKDDKGILNIGIFVSYSFEKFVSYSFEKNENLKINVFTIGPRMGYQFKLSDKTKIAIENTYAFGNYNFKAYDQYNSFELYSGNSKQNIYSFSANLLVSKFFIEPAVAISDGNVAYGISIGYIF